MRTLIRATLENVSPGVRRFIATESVFGIGAGIFTLILNLHLIDLGFNEKEIGQITALGALATGLLSLPAGLLVRYVGRKRMLVLGMAIAALSLIGFGVGTTPTAIIAAQLAWSVAMAAILNSEIQLIFDYCRDKREETQAYALLFAVFTLFTGAGTLLGGYLPMWLGGATTVYQYSFYAAAACLAIGALLRGLLLPAAAGELQDQPEQEAAPAAEDGRSGGFRHVYRLILILCAVIFMQGFTFGLLGPYLNVILKYRFSWSDGAISLVLTVSGLFLFLGSLLVPQLIDKWGVRRTFALMFVGNTAFALLLALNVPASLFSVLLLVRGGLFAMLSNMIDSEAMSAVPDRERNLFAGLRTIARSAGTAIAAYIAGLILATAEYRLPFLLTGITLALGYGLYVWLAQPIVERQSETRRT